MLNSNKWSFIEPKKIRQKSLSTISESGKLAGSEPSLSLGVLPICSSSVPPLMMSAWATDLIQRFAIEPDALNVFVVL
jgi:hypothetical protein